MGGLHVQCLGWVPLQNISHHAFGFLGCAAHAQRVFPFWKVRKSSLIETICLPDWTKNCGSFVMSYNPAKFYRCIFSSNPMLVCSAAFIQCPASCEYLEKKKERRLKYGILFYLSSLTYTCFKLLSVFVLLILRACKGVCCVRWVLLGGMSAICSPESAEVAGKRTEVW